MPCALSRRVLSGGFYSQYKANLPCLQGLLDLDRGESAEASPLADQARKILRDGGPAAIRSLQNAELARRHPERAAIGRQQTPAISSLGGVRATEEAENERGGASSAAPAAAIPEPQFAAAVPEPQFAMDDRQTSATTSSAGDNGPPSGNSWEAVRQRYQARAAGDDPVARQPAEVPPSDPSQPAGRPRRVVKNAYGDEVVMDDR